LVSKSTPHGGMPATASHLLVYTLLRTLMSKGFLNQSEAVSVPIRTAEMLRDAWAGEPDEINAEASSRQLETMASWLVPDSASLLSKELGK